MGSSKRTLASILGGLLGIKGKLERQGWELGAYSPPEPQDPPLSHDIPIWGPETKAIGDGEWRILTHADQEAVSLREAREAIKGAVRDYLTAPDVDYGLLIKAPPGVGKTTVGIWAAQEWVKQGGKRVLYAGPRHSFFDDIMAITSEPELWYEWLPRQEGGEGTVETCPYAAEINVWLARGHKAKDFCKQVCGWDHIHNSCKYYAQRKRGEPIIYGMHEHVTMGHILQFDLLIGDESPIGAFCHEWHIPARHVVPPNIYTETLFASELLPRLLVAVVNSDGRGVYGEQLMEALGGSAFVKEATSKYVEFYQPVPEIRSPYEVHEDKVEYCHCIPLAQLLYREACRANTGQGMIPRVYAINGELVLLCRRMPNEHCPRRAIWLDATANDHIYGALFRAMGKGWRWRAIAPSVRLKGNVYQVVDRSNSKSTLFEQRQEGEGASGSKKLAEAEELIEHIINTRGYVKPAIIAPKDVFSVSLELRRLDHGHFFAARGTNSLQDCDALFVLGTPLPPTRELVKLGAMIFYERDAPFDTVWRVKRKPYRWRGPNGEGVTQCVWNFWGDSEEDDITDSRAEQDLVAIVQAFREDEIVQAAHRARPILREVDIWLLTSLPTVDLPINRLFTINELFDAPNEVRLAKWREAYDVATCELSPGGDAGDAKIEILEEVARRISDREGIVTAADLQEALGLSSRTATKYIRLLGERDEFELVEGVRRKRGARGRPARGVRLKRGET